jgi:hypothetical protein
MRTLGLLAIPLILGACSDIEQRHVPPEPPGTLTAVPADLPTIVTVAGRQQTITIQSSPRGPVYTVARADGTTVVRQATLPDLQAARPDLYHQIKGYQADSAAWWAGSWGDR